MPRKSSKEILPDNLLIDLYKNKRLSSIKIGEVYNLNASTIQKRIKALGITRNITEARNLRTDSPASKYKIDEDYFEYINTPNKSYLLGFILADGNTYYPTKNSCRTTIKLQLKDKCFLEKIKTEVNYTGPIYIDNINNAAQLQIGNTNFTKHLIRHGVVPNKSYICQYPTINSLNHKDFVRGLLDADGSLCHYGYHHRLYILGTLNITFNIHKQWNDLGLNPTLTKKEYSPNLYEVLLRRKAEVSFMCNYLYKDASLYLKRKYDIASQYFDN